MLEKFYINEIIIIISGEHQGTQITDTTSSRGLQVICFQKAELSRYNENITAGCWVKKY